MTLFDAHSLALPVVIEYSTERCNGRRIDEEIKIDHFIIFHQLFLLKTITINNLQQYCL